MTSVYFDPAVGGDGSTVTDDSNPSTGMGNGGHRTRFVPALAQTVAVAGSAKNSAASALNAAATAINAPGTAGNSTTSLTIGTGSQALVIEPGKLFLAGMYVMVAGASVSNWMHGQITAYDPATGNLTVNVLNTGGGGTYASWRVIASAPLPTTFGQATLFAADVTAGAGLTHNGATAMLAQGHSAGGSAVEIGGANTTQANLDMHSKGGGTLNDYDFRLAVTGGGTGSNGGAAVDLLCATLKRSGNTIWDAGNFDPASKQAALGYTPVQQGTGIGQNGNTVKLGWAQVAGKLKATVDTFDQGNLAFESWVGSNYAALAGAVFTGSITSPGYFLASGGSLFLSSGGGAGAIYNSAGIHNAVIRVGAPGAEKYHVFNGDGTFALAGAEAKVGSGENEEKRVRLTNANRDLYLYLSQSGSQSGLYDNTSGITRWYTDSSGNFTAAGNVTAYSDIRIKADIAPLRDSIDVWGMVRAVDGITYTDKRTRHRAAGVIAQQLQPWLPEVIQQGQDGLLTVAYGNAALAIALALGRATDERLSALESRLQTTTEV